MGLRRLKKADGTASMELSADALADGMSKVVLRDAPDQNKFRAKVLGRKAVADWSSSESSEDEETSMQTSRDNGKENVSPMIAAKQSIKRPEAASRHVLQPNAPLSCDSDTTGRSSEHDSFLDCETLDGPDTDALVLGESIEYRLPGQLARKLYAHQVQGVRWLWSLFSLKRGGILGDDMGLGKTLQCATFIAGLLHSKLIRRALIVAPKTLLAQWRKELAVCGLENCLYELAPNSSLHERDSELQAVFRKPGVLLTTYGMVQHNADSFCNEPGSRFAGTTEADAKPLWDLLILDEGHKIKNAKTVIAQQLRQIPTTMAVIMSGTPIQNNLMEMHSLFDFVQPGLLGDKSFFKMEYEKIITRGNSKDASSRDRELANGRSKALRDRCAPYFLRREKKDVLDPKKGLDSLAASFLDKFDECSVSSLEGTGAAEDSAPKPQKLGCKNDLVIWLRLQPQQERIYEAFLNSQAVKEALNQSQSALAAITVLKKICVHPHLLSERAADAVAKGGGKLAAGTRIVTEDDFIVNDSEEEYETASSDSGGGEECAASDPEDTTLENDWLSWGEGQNVDEKLREIVKSRGSHHSCKTQFVASLVKELHTTGHRTLIFSQSRVMLDILGLLLGGMDIMFLRIDGTLSGPQREALVQRFQSSSEIPVFLLTSQVGGLGLTLTKADRVVIVDPAWNPSTDDQSVDRAYRIGQSRDVVVYRLISCGTVEEKIYRKQVFKGGLSRSGMKEGNPFQYFTQQDLRDLFRLEPEELLDSITQKQLHDLHAAQRQTSDALDDHLKILEGLPCFAGVSDHDLLYSKPTAEPAAQPQGPAFPADHAENRPARPTASSSSHQSDAFFRPNRAAKPAKKGSSDISDLLARSLQLGPSSEDSRPPGPGWKQLPEQPHPLRPVSKVSELQEQLARLVHLSHSSSLRLPDGGRQLQSKINDLERQLQALYKAGKPTQHAQNKSLETDEQIRATETACQSSKPAKDTGSWHMKQQLDPEPTGTSSQQDLAHCGSPSLHATQPLGKNTLSEPRANLGAKGSTLPTTNGLLVGSGGSANIVPGPLKAAPQATQPFLKALNVPFPDDDQQASKSTAGSTGTTESIKATNITRLEREAAQMKKELRNLVDALSAAGARDKLGAEEYRQQKVRAKELDMKRRVIREEVAKLKGDDL